MRDQSDGGKYLSLYCEFQHLKYVFEGYRECILIETYGENFVWENLQIDVNRHPPDGAKDISYQESKRMALKDLKDKV